MQRALEVLEALKERAARAGVTGQPRIQPRLAHGLDLHNLLTVSEAITRSAIERKESRGGHFREDYPEKDPAFGKVNIVVRKGADRSDAGRSRTPIPRDARRN